MDLIKSGGFRIGAGEIESVLLAHPGGVLECAVVGAPDPDLGQRVVAFVIAGDQAPAAAELIELVATELNNHKRPREIRFVDRLPPQRDGQGAEEAAAGAVTAPARPPRGSRAAGRTGITSCPGS